MWNIGVKVSHELAIGWAFRQAFCYGDSDRHQDGSDVRTALSSDGTIARGISRQDDRTDAISLGTRLVGEVATGRRGAANNMTSIRISTRSR